MKTRFSKIWFPLAVILIAALQAVGSDIFSGRLYGPAAYIEAKQNPKTEADTVIYDLKEVLTKFREEGFKAEGDSGWTEESDTNEVYLSARDTIHAPDSLKDIDPFWYRWYVATVDSTTHVWVRDSLRAAGDTLDWKRIDSLYYADSTAKAIKRFNDWYNGLSKDERKKYDFEQKMKRRQHMVDSILEVKDSLKAIKDSIAENKPRILETFALPDSMQYKRIITWNRDDYFSKVELQPIDTGYNYHFHEYPFYKKDVNATYLGPIGSPTRTYDFFQQKSVEGVSFYTPLETYTFSPSTLPFYNTKTPYTELAYWGTLFANVERQENNLHIMTTQNIYPSLNLTLEYDRYGSNGMLNREDTDNRTAVIAANYMGKRYLAHAAYIYNKMGRSENGGIIDNFWIRDTTVGSREIDVRMAGDASTLVKKNTVFLDQTYRIPFEFLKKFGEKKELRKERAWADSIRAAGDSLAIAEMEEILAQRQADREEKAAADTIDNDVTTAFIGHSSEFSTYRKIYDDKISLSDSAARAFCNNTFLINPIVSHDSLRVMKLDNKIFIKLQPWSRDAIVSTLNVGIGDKLRNYYMFRPKGYLYKGGSNTVWNSLYLYGGIGGQYRKFLQWDASGRYTFAGQEVNDFALSANAKVSIYPFRRHRHSPMTFDAHFETSLTEPEYYEQHYWSNHYAWDNNFSKISDTRIEGGMSVPHWKLYVRAGYAMLKNNIFYGQDAIIRQNTAPMSVLRFSLRKDLSFWKLHLDVKALAQFSSDEKVLPLPSLALNARAYFQFNIVRNVLQMQIGANATYTTKWYEPGYSPALGQFYNQREEKYGNCPYIDAFVNMQWKRACIFVKIVNVNMGWPNESADYFSAHGYIRPQRALKFGVFWPFYISPNRNSPVGDRAGSSMVGGGSRSSSGSSSSGGLGGIGGGIGGALKGLN